jgi:hypothetical protein
MAQSVTANIQVQVNALLSQTVGLGAGSVQINAKASNDFADGAGANQVHLVWSSLARSIAASSSETHDLNAVLTDAFGNSITMTKLKAVFIAAAATNVNDVLIGGGSTPVALFADISDIMPIKPGGTLLLVAPGAAGYPVVAATGDLLKVANSSSGTAVVYDIVLLGA